MKMKVIAVGCIMLAGVCTCRAGDNKTKQSLKDAGKQLEYALLCVDSALLEKPTSRGGRKNVVPRSIEKDGSLRVVNSYDWCSGFFPGSLWQMYEHTGKKEWKETADKYSWAIEDAKDFHGTHDLGFMLFCSFGKAYQLTGEDRYKDVALHAADVLIKRYNPTVGCIKSWDIRRDGWQFPVIIDNMMNLELLFWATEMTGDSTYYNIAVTHANTTIKHQYRPDYSSYHVLLYDDVTGNVLNKVTAQGLSSESVWSRGQSWGLYGFITCYRFTRNEAYLEQAKNIAGFMLSHPNLPADMVPYWDLSDPGIPNVPRDASSAAILASALYELDELIPGNKAGYKQKADFILNSLSQDYTAKIGTTKGFLLKHSTGHLPAKDEIDVPIVYADYYYLEALLRKQKADSKK